MKSSCHVLGYSKNTDYACMCANWPTLVEHFWKCMRKSDVMCLLPQDIESNGDKAALVLSTPTLLDRGPA